MKGKKPQRGLFNPSKSHKPPEWKRTDPKRPSNEVQSNQAVVAESNQVAQNIVSTPFFLMSNNILHATGYSKFTAKITPRLVPSALNALNVDALFSFHHLLYKNQATKRRVLSRKIHSSVSTK
ncbi:hypothetical protein BCV72DRAFT_111949 [Rhizopus microsporus var. microsporus]|uniref:Uncharacterized protein n=1 Tax=Rhizopus microsporus var. microsporus TaxID=86635 RepID=A0A1X0R515_RHIZD|nr:hypothetical protein BCV72DRAFT_111949 [Rhizopus microsporus var. microsporus]